MTTTTTIPTIEKPKAVSRAEWLAARRAHLAKEKELTLATGYIQKKTSSKDDKAELTVAKRQAYEDIIWALINTKEFLFNH